MKTLSILLVLLSSAHAQAASQWGGQGVSLTVADDGSARIELDCAHGELSGWNPNSFPQVRLPGYLQSEASGIQILPKEPARYSAQLERADLLALKIEVAGRAPQIYKAVRNASPALFKCLMP
jgi:hypothetical protein